MGARIRGVAVAAVVLGAGAYLGSSIEGWWTGSEAGLGSGAPTWDGERVRVEVLNAGGRSGMAREATDRLRKDGFDVVYWGNAGSFGRETSVVLDRVGRLETARSVAEALGIEGVREEVDSTLLLDVSVMLGQDWEPPAAAQETAEAAWWDVRRLFRGGAGESVGPMADPRKGDDGRDDPGP